jgi:Uncharacterized protein conserved in bacteria (DUF2252)
MSLTDKKSEADKAHTSAGRPRRRARSELDILNVSAKDKMAAGRALREKVPRSAHAKRMPAPNRPDPIELLTQSDRHRIKELLPIRYGRMKQSPFAFYRGSAALMAFELAGTPTTRLRVQACGDCHIANFGGFGSPERRLVFDINDFDGTLPAPWEWDVKRLAASVVLGTGNCNSPQAPLSTCACALLRSSFLDEDFRIQQRIPHCTGNSASRDCFK